MLDIRQKCVIYFEFSVLCAESIAKRLKISCLMSSCLLIISFFFFLSKLQM